MFKTVLVAIERVARDTARQAASESGEQRRTKAKDKPETRVVKESVPARSLAHLLIGMLGFLEKTNTLHQQIFDGFVYLLLERVGQRLFYCTFGRHRSSTVEGDIEPLPEPQSAEETRKAEVDAHGTRLEVKALLLVLERAIGLAPNHMNPQASTIDSNKKKSGRTISLKNLPAASKARLSPVAKERLQRTQSPCHPRGWDRCRTSRKSRTVVSMIGTRRRSGGSLVGTSWPGRVGGCEREYADGLFCSCYGQYCCIV
jgi:hypothetical protein